MKNRSRTRIPLRSAPLPEASLSNRDKHRESRGWRVIRVGRGKTVDHFLPSTQWPLSRTLALSSPKRNPTSRKLLLLSTSVTLEQRRTFRPESRSTSTTTQTSRRTQGSLGSLAAGNGASSPLPHPPGLSGSQFFTHSHSHTQ